ncbi:hypothetical protein pEaSNUABM37_00079 [Erwinia phage pEa_SNUABM_37]|nr:hypothetical protein pEaSNUABM37_00079 [Erwinia phage pEa_SNUABM_37]QXO10549.1 hypothetical protein pEaSNUABM48_00079 [Erwinia phage pEa_SNUABM_48]
MPFIVYKAKKVKLTPAAFQQVIRIFRKKKRNLDNICVKEVYVLDTDDHGEFLTAKGTLIVLVNVNGKPTQFTHLWGGDIRDMLDAFHPELEETDHRVRLDHECHIDDFRGVTYTRY